MVYIDNVNLPYGRMIMNHMVADTQEELFEMVDKIGVQRKWIQDKGTYREHFDVSLEKKKLAIKYGAKDVGNSEMGCILSKKKKKKQK